MLSLWKDLGIKAYVFDVDCIVFQLLYITVVSLPQLYLYKRHHRPHTECSQEQRHLVSVVVSHVD